MSPSRLCCRPLPASPRPQAGISHFLDVVTEGAQPRLGAADCLAAAAVMAAAEQSLRTGAPVAVSHDWAAAAAPTGATATVTLAGPAAASKLGGAASALVEGARQLVQAARQASGTCTPPERAASEEGEERVSTPPHQGTPPPKSVSTPESPALLPCSHVH